MVYPALCDRCNQDIGVEHDIKGSWLCESCLYDEPYEPPPERDEQSAPEKAMATEKEIDVAAQAIADRRGLANINHEHPMWAYFLEDAKAVLDAVERVRIGRSDE